MKIVDAFNVSIDVIAAKTFLELDSQLISRIEKFDKLAHDKKKLRV